jgi:DNA primase
MNSTTKISQEWLQGVLERTDIVEVVGAELKLERIGKEHRACCPFHPEKTPSFTVNSQKRFFHCFGCGKHGNAIDFLMQHRGLGFRDAVADLARRAGIGLPMDSFPRDQRGEHEVIKACQLFHTFFQAELPTQSERLAVLGIDRELARRFQLGYAPADYTVPMDSSPALAEAGLVTSDGRPKIVDRLVLPVKAAGGATIGLVAVELPDRAPTPPIVCGLTAVWDHLMQDPGQPRVRGGDLFVVLSPLEMLPLTALGIVAASIPVHYPLSGHFVRLSRLADQVTLCLPEGPAGEMIAVLAAHQLVNVLDADSASMRVLFSQSTWSLSQVIRRMGVDTFKERARTAEPLLDAAIRLLSQRLNPLQTEDRRRYLGHMKRFSNATNHPVGLITVDAMMQAWRLPHNEAHAVIEGLRSDISRTVSNVALSPRSAAIRILSILVRYPSYTQYIPAIPNSPDPGIGLLRELCSHLRAHPNSDISRFVETHPRKSLLSQLAAQTCSPDPLVDLVQALEDLRIPLHPRRATTLRPAS